MISNEPVRGKKVFISWLEENNETKQGYVFLLEQNESFVKFKTTGGNILTIPFQRILKIKEVDNNAL